MKITVQLLRGFDACSEQVKRFSKLYPDGVSYTTQAGLQRLVNKASKQGLDVVWFIEKMKLSCVCRRHYESGQLWYENNYTEGVLNGVWREYHKNGQLWYECSYKDGKIDGAYREYYERGQLRGEGNYKDGKRNGICKVYYKNGQLKKEQKYKDGDLVKETP